MWEAKDAYWIMSPFMQADKITKPLLLIHGEADNNPGTYPMQSERLYQALKVTLHYILCIGHRFLSFLLG